MIERPRLALFVDGWNFKHTTFDGFGMWVDWEKLLKHFSRDAFLIRALYYTGFWTPGAIDAYVQGTQPENPDEARQGLEETRGKEYQFHRWLNRNGYTVVSKPIKVQTSNGRVIPKANLDIEIAVDMLALADRTDKQVLFSGDGDFAPLVRAVCAHGVRVAVVHTQSEEALNRGRRASTELLDAADQFIDIKDIFDHIVRGPKPAAHPVEPDWPEVPKDILELEVEELHDGSASSAKRDKR